MFANIADGIQILVSLCRFITFYANSSVPAIAPYGFAVRGCYNGYCLYKLPG